MFEAEEKHGSQLEFFDKLKNSDSTSLDLACSLAEIMSRQGAAVRKLYGQPESEIFVAAYKPLISRLTMIHLTNALMQTINSGLQQEVSSEDEEIDLGLLELQKKTESSPAQPNT